MELPVPARVSEYADQVVEYVRRALGVRLEYDSDTLPVLDHYLRTVAGSQPETRQLVIVTAGAYFGEVARRQLGGRWELGEADGDPGTADRPARAEIAWRMVLPSGLNFAPAGVVAAAIAQSDLDDVDSEIDVPARMRTHLQEALQRMGEVTVEDYYSLCGRLDTLEHLHEVLVGVAAQMMGDLEGGAAAEGEDDLPEPIGDDPSGAVN